MSRETLVRLSLVVCLAIVFAGGYLFRDRIVSVQREELLQRRVSLPRALLYAAQYTSSLAAGERPLFAPGEQQRTELSDLPSRVAALSLGGLRGFLAVYLWVDAETSKNLKVQEDLLDKYHRIANLQPDYTSVWDHHAWNQAWNLSAEATTPERRWEWVRYGIEFLREGIRRNPRSIDLLETMGRIYEQRIAQNGRAEDRDYFTAQVEATEGEYPLRLAYKWYRLARQVQDETGKPHNLFSKKILHQRSCFAAHEYAKTLTLDALGDLKEAVDMMAAPDRREDAVREMERGRRGIETALTWWNQTIEEWQRQLTQFPDDRNAETFGGGAVQARREVRSLLQYLTPTYLADHTHDFSVRVESAHGHRLLVARNIYDLEPPEKFQGPDFSLAPRDGNR